MRVAVLDDYQGIAHSLAAWDELAVDEIVFVQEYLPTLQARVERLRDFEIVVAMRERTWFTRELLEQLPKLRMIASTGTWNAAIDLEAAAERGITVCGTGEVTTSTPEFVWAMILSLVRHIPEEDANVRAGRWQSSLGIDLAGKTIGIVGLGHVGSRVAQVAAVFGMTIIAWSPNLTPERAAEHGARYVGLDELMAEADVVTLHVRLNEETIGLIDKRRLGLMKPTAFLVNTARGPMVDEAALVEALESGSIAGAAVDVYSVEPLPADSPLRTMPRSVLTPHVGFVAEACYRRFYEDAVEDIATFLAGAPVRVMTV
ncbi:D-2-hydroxyacid dehydrogenase family protein [Pseudonocardia sp. RS010]|uniref:D-2-hydroxyacid dehydrogenase family protein n=1 Tax=Pseudonocardia sp. RS010 TaxID=3385979 RepID=UPI0039A3C5AE